MFARKRLERLAQQDCGGERIRIALSTTESIEPSTPTVQAIQARANAYARREEQRFFSRVDRELTEHRMLIRALDDRPRRLRGEDRRPRHRPTAKRSPKGAGPPSRSCGGSERRIRRGHRRADELSALIHSRFTAAQLRANRYYDHSDEKIAIYWGAFRRSGTQRPARRPRARAAALGLADDQREQTKLLELWQGRTDAQA